MAIATAARKSQNHEEAYTYYTKVLELDPKNYEAWLYRGEAAGRLSSLSNLRIEEMVLGIENALKFSPPEKKESIKAEGARLINNVVSVYHKQNLEDMNKFGSLADARRDYLQHCANALRAWGAANYYDPTNREIIDNGISQLMEILEGVEYTDCDECKTVRVFHFPNSEALIMPDLNKFIAMRKAIDPSYKPPSIKKKR